MENGLYWRLDSSSPFSTLLYVIWTSSRPQYKYEHNFCKATIEPASCERPFISHQYCLIASTVTVILGEFFYDLAVRTSLNGRAHCAPVDARLASLIAKGTVSLVPDVDADMNVAIVSPAGLLARLTTVE